ncbi:MAG: hypothetical protein HXY24_16325, partial [Rubrivivax sp.]|nr:hypothetical protein [Rubrivivax sp.]
AGLRFGGLVQIRDIWAEEIEAALQGTKSAQAALDAAVARGTQALPEGFRASQATISVLDRPEGRQLGMRVLYVR